MVWRLKCWRESTLSYTIVLYRNKSPQRRYLLFHAIFPSHLTILNYLLESSCPQQDSLYLYFVGRCSTMMGNWKLGSQRQSTNRSVHVRRCVSDNLFNGRNIMCFLEHTFVTSFKIKCKDFHVDNSFRICFTGQRKTQRWRSDKTVVKLQCHVSHFQNEFARH